MREKDFIEEVNYIVKLGDEEWHYTLELHESGAFKYGNGTCVIMRLEGNLPEVYDTRYERGITQDFVGWCDEFMKHRIVKTATIMRV